MRVFIFGFGLLLVSCVQPASADPQDVERCVQAVEEDEPVAPSAGALNGPTSPEGIEEWSDEDIDERAALRTTQSAYQHALASRRRRPQREPRVVMPRLVPEERVEVTMADDPALALARICVSEEGWSSIRGCTAIWQVVRNVRSRSCNTTRYRRISQCVRQDGQTFVPSPGVNTLDAQETNLSAMRRLSKFVTGMAPPVRPRQEWTSTLRDSHEPPLRWIECNGNGIPAGCHGTWLRHVDNWERIRTHARRLLSGYEAAACRASVIAWGGLMDREVLRRRNTRRASMGRAPLVRVDCGATLNMFYAVERGAG